MTDVYLYVIIDKTLLYIVVTLIQSKQIQFHILCELKQIENSYKSHMQTIEKLCKKQTKTRHFQMIPNSKKINMRGYGNFKKHQHPIKPDGYAI